MTLLHYNTPAITAAVTEIQAVAAKTEDNHQRSLAIVASNADNLQGQASEAFQQAIAVVNARYQQDQELLVRAAQTLQSSNDNMTMADAHAAGQYGV